MSKFGVDPRVFSAAGLTTGVDMARRFATNAFRKRKRAPASRRASRFAKRARTYKSKYKRKSKKGTKNIQGKNVSVKNIGRKLPRVYYPVVKTTASHTYEHNGATNITSQQGRHKYDEFSMGGAVGATTLTSVGPAWTNGNAADLSNVFIAAFGNEVAALDHSRQGKILVRSIQMTLFYTNMTDGYLHFTLYDILPRRDTDSSPLTAANSGARTLLDGTAVNGTEPIPSSEALTHIGVELSQLPHFNSKWMIVNRRTIIMSPGQVHRHTLNYGINKVMNASLLDAQNTYLRGFAAFHVVKIHGFPADTADNAVTTLTSGKLSCVFRKRVRYHIIDRAAPTKYAYNNIEDDGVALENMNADGDVEAQANA